MATIKAPFNFVPLSDKVFFPDWANQISQDIPFKDGISGTIELKITAKSPIFVRNGHTRQDADDKSDEYKSFSKTPDGKYFIPATSIKGAVRNVLEIMSFGKMAQEQVQNQTFGLRDLSDGVDGKFYRGKIKPENIHCGWLRKIDDKYFIDDCGTPWRISIEELDRKFGCGLDDFVKKGDFTIDINRTAQKKYELFNNINLSNSFSADEDLRKSLKVGGRKFVRFDDDGEGGTIVFTGQSGKREQGKKTNKKGEKTWTGKYYEFVFPQKTIRKDIEVDDYTIKEFISIHKNSPDYKDFRKDELNLGDEIPIFFMYGDNGKDIDTIGLSYMYKYPAFNSIYNAIPEKLLFSDQADLAECILGYTNSQSLKGRVVFTHAFADGKPTECAETNIVLSSPNPSYYPLYLGNGQTWNSEKITIAGRKRYPVRNNIMPSPKGTDAMGNIIRPLDKNSIFKSKIIFHNLKKIELGALLSALTFHGANDCYYNIGEGKPLGYGKVKIDVELNSILSNLSDYLNCFEEKMNEKLEHWKTQPQIVELFAMAKGIPSEKESLFSYMHMDTDRKSNEFLKARDAYSNGEQLGSFSQILNNNVPKSIYNNNVDDKLQRKNEEKILDEKRKKEESFNAIFTDAVLLFNAGKYADAQIKFEEANRIISNRSDVEDYIDRIKNIQQKFQSQFNALMAEANLLFADKKYEEAKAKYKEANDMDIENLSYKINECNEEIQKIDTLSKSNIEDVVKCSSIAAFAGGMKKWVAIHDHITEDNCLKVGNVLKSEVRKMNKNKQKDWFVYEKWKPIIDSIGEDSAKKIFDAFRKE